MKNIKYIGWYFKKYKTQYTIGIVFLLLSYLVAPIPNKIIGDFIDAISNRTLDSSALLRFSGIAFGSIALTYIINYVWHYYIFGHSFQASWDNRQRFVAKIIKQSPEFYSKNSSGSLMSKATQDVGAIETLTGYGIMATFEATVYPLIIIIIMGFTTSWAMTAVSIVALPSIVYVTKVLGKKLFEGHTRIQQSQDKIFESVMENITSVRVIKGFSTQEVAQERFDKSADDLYDNRIRLTKIDSIFIPISRIIPALTFVIALVFGQILISRQELTLGELTSFFLYLNMLVWPMMAFGDLINVIQESATSLKRLEEIYSYQEDVVDRPENETYLANGQIAFDNFSFKYPGTDKKVLDSITFAIDKGQTLGIVGKIGSGKTSLVKQLLRFYNVDQGQINLDGKPIEQYSIASVRDKIGYVPQQHLLFSKSVYDNIAFGKNGASHEEIMDAIEFADFTKDLHTLPNGLETLIGEKGISISGGQKQRVSISRAFIKDPEILILDDSLSAVDSITEKKIIENIRANRQGKTTIIIAHRLSGVRDADKIIVLDQGRIVEEGTHEELLANRAWYYTQYESQKSGGSNE